MVLAADGATGNSRAADFRDATLSTRWAEEKEISDEAVLVVLADGCGLDGKNLIETAKQDVYSQQLQSTTDEAHNKDTFGSPIYVVEGGLFWGQDRIDFFGAVS